MENKSSIQVQPGHYDKLSYNNLERFISYYYQIETVRKLNVKNVLEIGAGNKFVASILKDVGIDVTVCDFDISLNPDIVSDVRDIKLPNNGFDLVLACQVLEHIPFEDVSKALTEIVRISRRYAVISLPYRSTHFELLLKFPFIRKIFKKNFFDFCIRKALKFPGFVISKQHYWEIDNGDYTLAKVRKEILRYFQIIEEFSPPLNKFHYFFVLELKNILK